MIKTVAIIVISVSIFGILFFLYVKRAVKKQLGLLLNKKQKEVRLDHLDKIL